MNRTNLIAAGITSTFCFLVGLLFNPSPVLAQFIQWSRDEVVPVVIVEPSMGQFIPRGGTALQGSWRKDKVVALLLVKSNNLGGFIPADGGYGSMIGNTWQKDDVRPFVFLKPNGFGAFVPTN